MLLKEYMILFIYLSMCVCVRESLSSLKRFENQRLSILRFKFKTSFVDAFLIKMFKWKDVDFRISWENSNSLSQHTQTWIDRLIDR